MNRIGIPKYLLVAAGCFPFLAIGFEPPPRYLRDRVDLDNLAAYAAANHESDNGQSRTSTPIEISYSHRSESEVECVDDDTHFKPAAWGLSLRTDAYTRGDTRMQVSSDHFAIGGATFFLDLCSHAGDYYTFEVGAEATDDDQTFPQEGPYARASWQSPSRFGAYVTDIYIYRLESENSRDWAYDAAFGTLVESHRIRIGFGALARYRKSSDGRFHTIPSAVASASWRYERLTFMGSVQREVRHDKNGTYVEIGLQYGLGLD